MQPREWSHCFTAEPLAVDGPAPDPSPVRANPPEADPEGDERAADVVSIHRAAESASVGTLEAGGRKVTVMLWPAKTWTWMDFPAGVSRLGCGRWFAVRAD